MVAYTDLFRSGKRPARGFDKRPSHDRKSVSHQSHSIFHWLRLIRSPVQYCPQAHVSEVLASNYDADVGHRLYTDGRLTESRWLLDRALLPRCVGEWSVRRCGLLSIYVVQKRRSTLSCCALFQRGITCRGLWWYSCLGHCSYERRGWLCRLALDLHLGIYGPTHYYKSTILTNQI